MQDSNQPTQLQRLARMLKFCVEQVYQLYFNTWERTTKPLIRLCGCVGWSAPLMRVWMGGSGIHYSLKI